MLAAHSSTCRSRIFALVTILFAFTMAGCFRSQEAGAPTTVHWDRDRDEFCGMVVSDRRFAAQVIEPVGTAHVFDDIGCLVEWLDRQPWSDKARLWVRDRHVDRWIDPERAQWRSGETTPSGYGFGASLEPGYGTLTFGDVRSAILTRQGRPAPAAMLRPEPSAPERR